MFSNLTKSINRWQTRRRLIKQGIFSTRSRKSESRWSKAVDKSRVLGILLLILLWCVITVMMIVPARTEKMFDWAVGSVSPYSITAEADFSYENTAATRQARVHAAAEVPLVYVVSEKQNNEIVSEFLRFFASVHARSEKKAITNSSAEGRFVAQLTDSLDDDSIAVLNAVYETGAQDTDSAFRKMLNESLQRGFCSDALRSVSPQRKIQITDTLQRSFTLYLGQAPGVWDVAGILATQAKEAAVARGIPAADKTIESIRNVFFKLLGGSGNLVAGKGMDVEEASAMRRVKPIIVNVTARQLIVEKGQIIGEEELDRLSAYASVLSARDREKLEKIQVFQNMFWSLVVVIFIGLYMYHLHPEIVNSNKRVGLMGAVVILSLVVCYFSIKIFDYANDIWHLSPDLVINSVPLSLASILLAAMLGFRVALFGGLLVSAVISIMLHQGFAFAFEGMLGCAICALAVRNVTSYRTFFLRTILVVFATGWLLDFNLDRFLFDWHLVLPALAVALINGFVTAILAQIAIFVFELLFNINTKMSLMMLCDYSHPLLERLKREAPGTFFHSLMVSTLAEDAARAIEANPLSSKVGALFHDIGKLSKPQYFTENNLENDNRHIELNPHVSSMIIRDHVKEGLSLARQHNLNRVIKDAIEQHHGNDLVHYFYQRAMDGQKGGNSVMESQFRYQGSPPQSKEMAIISLADACEAAARALEKPTASKIDALVDEIFRKRFRDGQLVEANLTLAELNKVKESFVNNLVSMRHGRVSYNKEEEDEGDLFMAGEKPEKAEEKPSPQAY